MPTATEKKRYRVEFTTTGHGYGFVYADDEDEARRIFNQGGSIEDDTQTEWSFDEFRYAALDE